jgi:DNA-binding response OmpR family regulator
MCIRDSPETVHLLNLMLARLGYQAIVANDGKEALSLARKELPDLIVLDVMMPGLDGFEVARSLRRHPDTASIPILMLTAKTQIEDKVAGYDAGADIYLTKPIHPVDLYANIKTMLAKRHEGVAIPEKKSHTVGILASKGGLGVSTLAINLAIAYFQKKDSMVIAAEMRPGQGSWSEELKLTNPSGLGFLLRRETKDITEPNIEKQLVATSFGIFLLLASHYTSDIVCMSALVQYEAILQGLSALADLVVLDIGTNFHPAFNILVESCDEIVMVIEPQLITVRRTRMMIDELRERGIGGVKPLTVAMVNRAQSSMNLNVSQIEEILGHPLGLGFPHAAELANLAAERSTPMILLQPEGMIARQYNALADIIASHIVK